MKSKIFSFLKNVLVISGFLLLGVITGAAVVLLELNKILGDIFSYFKKKFKKGE